MARKSKVEEKPKKRRKVVFQHNGRLVPRAKGAEMMKIVFMIYEGKVSEQDGQKLFDELMNLETGSNMKGGFA